MVALLAKNVHVGSLGDIITYPIDVDPDLNISKVQLLDAIIHELSSNGFSDSEESDYLIKLQVFLMALATNIDVKVQA